MSTAPERETDEQQAIKLLEHYGFTEGDFGTERMVKAALLEAQRLAREDERRICIEAMCPMCKAGVKLDDMSHRYEDGLFMDACRAWRIRSRQPGGAK